ncbi:MAG: hypothetical protein EXR69_00535 [Myxococcales bacterium]|nr:hypothetical protein [Myxococcales bacterium]
MSGLAVWGLCGCALVRDTDLDDRMDLDGDGGPRPDDCDDDDPAIGATGGFYVDADGDGYGGLAETDTCVLGYGRSARRDDCNDSNPAVFPGAVEVCNYYDDNCDGEVNEGQEPPSWYPDGDGDGYGSALGVAVCEQPEGFLADDQDCDDTDAEINPDTLWYPDSDGDGYGDMHSPAVSCEPPAGSIGDSADCDDTRADVSPTGQEVCDAAMADEDCDGHRRRRPVGDRPDGVVPRWGRGRVGHPDGCVARPGVRRSGWLRGQLEGLR